MKLSERNEERKIEERIQQLRAEAEERGIYKKAAEVARLLGDWKQKKHGHNVNYSTFVLDGGERHTLGIYWDSYAPNLSVYWDGATVFTAHLGDITRYRPDMGGWWAALEEIHQKQVTPILERQERAEAERRAKEIRANWGIEVKPK